MGASPIDVVLFDLGGVLVRLAGVGEMARLAGMADEDVWERWLACPWVRDYERGRCAREAFVEGVARTWNLSVGPAEFLRVFEAWPRGLFPGAADLLCSVGRRARLACLSNTNELHWSRQGHEWGLEEHFDHRFLSFETGRIKPDREAYEHVVETLASPPERILFLDDNPINVHGARAVGLDAELAVGVDGARDVLRRRGLVDA